MYFDRIDICEAYFVYAMLWHGGQFTKEYKIFGRLNAIPFKPRQSLKDEDGLSENGKTLYLSLVARKEVL